MKTKKLLSLLLTVIMVLSSVSVLALGASAAVSMRLTSDKAKASIGEIVTVNVDIPSGLSGIAFGVQYDSSYFSVISAKATNLFGNAAVSTNDGRIGYAGAVNGKTVPAGTVMVITVKVLKLNGTFTVNVKEALDGNDNEVKVNSASLTIKAGDKVINYPDVRENDWYYDAVAYCAEKGYITGYNDGRFGAADAIQRQDFVLIFSRIDGADLKGYAGKTGGFNDVVKDAYYASAVAWGAEKGIITGYNASKFGVGDKITREQVCTIIYRYMGSPEVENADKTLSPFADKGKISAYAYNAVAWCVANGIITGKNATTVAPGESASRAQIATIIMRMDEQDMFSKA